MSRRIVSLIASGTEIVSALGFGDQLVGRSHECDFPPSVLDLPACTEAKIPLSGSSLEIDKSVRSVLENELSVYRVFTDLLEELNPDLIVTQALCDICAVSLEDVQGACLSLSRQPELLSLEPNVLKDVWEDIRKVAGALGVLSEGERLVANCRRRLSQIRQLCDPGETPTRVVCIEWIEPLLAAGNWIPQLVEIAGGRDLLGPVGTHAPWLEGKDLKGVDPEVLIVMPCGFGLQRTRAEMSAMTSLPAWSSLRAVREGQVFLTDGNHFFNRPGPRLVESAEILAEILAESTPGRTVDFGHQGVAWQPL